MQSWQVAGSDVIRNVANTVTDGWYSVTYWHNAVRQKQHFSSSCPDTHSAFCPTTALTQAEESDVRVACRADALAHGESQLYVQMERGTAARLPRSHLRHYMQSRAPSHCTDKDTMRRKNIPISDGAGNILPYWRNNNFPIASCLQHCISYCQWNTH